MSSQAQSPEPEGPGRRAKQQEKRLASLLLGHGLCSGKSFAATLFLSLLIGAPILALSIFLMVSLLGKGPEPDQKYLMDLAMFGTAAALSLLAWILLGQALRRIRSTGQLWLGFFLILAAPFPILLVPLGFALSLWTGKERVAHPLPALSWHWVVAPCPHLAGRVFLFRTARIPSDFRVPDIQ